MKANLIASVFLLGFVGVIVWVILSDSQQGGTAKPGDLVLMDFYADWCGPCMAMKPVVHELEGELHGQITIMEVNVDSNRDLALLYNIRSIPCFVVTKGGREISRQTGSMPKESLRQLTGL